MDRDDLRAKLVERQDGICVICGHGMYGDAAVHEAIVKRGDLPGDSQVFDERNCIAIHNRCHKNTRAVDCAAMEYLIGSYGIDAIFDWICSLDMTILPGRAREIVAEKEQKARSREYI